MKKLNILIIGSGAREHAFGWAVKRSPRCGKLYFSPGNAGTASIGENLPYAVSDLELLLAFCQGEKIGLVIVGPEAPLAAGIVDLFRKNDIPIVGPTRNAARLETSKADAKRLMEDWGIPTARFHVFNEHDRAVAHVRAHRHPLFIKASGLAAGKGAFPCATVEESENVLRQLMVEDALGKAGREVVIEELLEGPEVSVHAFCDGKDFTLAPATQDHKRLLIAGQYRPDGTNPNTGGMGAIGPVPYVDVDTMDYLHYLADRTLMAVQDRLREAYTGILYPGIMLTEDQPMVLEYNARGGDPETQVLMRLLKSDAVDLFEAMATGRLGKTKVEWHERTYAACIVLTARGYPEKPEKDHIIRGLTEAEATHESVVIFHAGTRTPEKYPGTFITDGGRVLSVTATGGSLAEALDRAYRAVDKISWSGMHYRVDIGHAAMQRIFEASL